MHWLARFLAVPCCEQCRFQPSSGLGVRYQYCRKVGQLSLLKPYSQDSKTVTISKMRSCFPLSPQAPANFWLGKHDHHRRYLGGCLLLHQPWEAGLQAQRFPYRYADERTMVPGSSGFLVWSVEGLGSTSPFLSPIDHHCPIPTLKWKSKLHPPSSVVPFLVCTLDRIT